MSSLKPVKCPVCGLEDFGAATIDLLQNHMGLMQQEIDRLQQDKIRLKRQLHNALEEITRLKGTHFE